ERDTVDGAAVTDVQRPGQVVALYVPQADRPVVAVSSRERSTVGTVGNAVDEMMGPQRQAERPAASEVPQHDGPADVSGREGAATGTERDGSVRAGVIVQLSEQAVAVHVPQLDRAAGARGRDDPPVWTERDAVDRAGVRR